MEGRRNITCNKCNRTFQIDDKERFFICPNCDVIVNLSTGVERYYGQKLLDPHGKEEVITRENIDMMVQKINSDYKCGLIHAKMEDSRDYIVIDKQKIDVTEWENTWKYRFLEAVYYPFLQCVQQGLPKWSDGSLLLSDEAFGMTRLQIGTWNERSSLREYVRQTKIVVKWRLNTYIENKKLKGEITSDDYEHTKQVLEDTLIAIEKFEGCKYSDLALD